MYGMLVCFGADSCDLKGVMTKRTFILEEVLGKLNCTLFKRTSIAFNFDREVRSRRQASRKHVLNIPWAKEICIRLLEKSGEFF